MNFLKRWFSNTTKPLKEVTVLGALEQLDRIEEMLAPENQIPVGNYFHDLYNLSMAVGHNFDIDIVKMGGTRITTLSSNCKLLVETLYACHDTEINHVVLLAVYHNKPMKDRYFLDWFNNKNILNAFLKEMQTWLAIANRAQYERYQDCLLVDYDKPITSAEFSLVYSTIFKKLTLDHINLLRILLEFKEEETNLGNHR